MMHVAAATARLSQMRTKVGAAAVRGGRVLAIGHNKPGSSSHSPTAWSRHAEIVCCTNVDVRGSTVYVYREHGLTGQPLMAKPCASCEAYLRAAEVKRVVYTSQEGEVEWKL